MSVHESRFIKWFAGIAGSLVVLTIVALLGMWKAGGIQAQEIEQNKNEILETREYHQRDIDNVMFYMREIREDQKEIKKDIKELLKK